MKKIILMLTILTLLLTSCGGSGILEERWINGEKLIFEVGESKPYSGEYTITEYNYDGSEYVSESGTYKKGKLDGKTTYFTNRNEKLKEVNYKKGIKHGVTKQWSKGTLIKEINYKNGLKDGVAKEWNDQGKLIFKADYKNNKINGRLTIYQFGDEKTTDLEYENGNIIKGYDKIYYSKKEIRKETQYKKDGTTLYSGYYEGNILEFEKAYSNDKPIYVKKYSRSGKISSEEYYYKNGKLKNVKTYNEGIPYNFAWYNESGQLLQSEQYNENGKPLEFVWYNENKKVSQKEKYTKYGKPLEFSWYNENGDILKKEVYDNGKLVATRNYQ